jgi:hypothetical protein
MLEDFHIIRPFTIIKHIRRSKMDYLLGQSGGNDNSAKKA